MWTLDQVEKHNAGLTDKQKTVWVRVANAALEEKATEADSIARANAAVVSVQGSMVLNAIRHAVNMSDLVQEIVWEDEPYWVMPTVLMVEGVHNKLMYPSDELAEFACAWNGAPVVVDHPRTKDGANVSANHPDVLTARRVGQLFNVRMEGTKLMGDAYINKARAQRVSPQLVQMILDGGRIEVSTGVYIIEEEKAGEWNGEKYVGIARDHRPDHLALLPGGSGACSWEDGAGTPRLNARGEGQGVGGDQQGDGGTDTCKCPNCGKIVAHERGTPCVETVCPSCGAKMVGNVEDNAVMKKEQDGEHPSGHYLVVEDTAKPTTWHLRVKGPDGKVDHRLMGAAWAALHEGYRGQKYQGPNKQEALEKLRRLYKSEDMAVPTEHERGNEMERKSVVDALIRANQRWVEEDREYLMGLSDEAFARITKEPEEPAKPQTLEEMLTGKGADDDSAAVKAARQAFADAASEKPETVETVIANVKDESVRAVLTVAVKAYEDAKTETIKALVANKRCTFTEDQLKAKSMDELHALLSLSGVNAPSFAGRSTGKTEEEDETIPLPQYNWKRE